MNKFILAGLLSLTLAFSIFDTFKGGPAYLLSEKIYDIIIKKQSNSRFFSDEIIFIDISQSSLSHLEPDLGKWPWPRAVHGDLINTLDATKAKAVIFDLLFNERDIQNPDSDLFFNSSLKNVPAYFPSFFTKNISLSPTVINPEYRKTGHVEFNLDSDGIGRHYTYKNRSTLDSLVLLASKKAPEKIPPNVRLNFYNTNSIKTYAYHDILLNLKKINIKDKYVIIGTTAPGLGDFVSTPLGTSFPGALILATALQNLLDNSYIKEPNIYIRLIFSLLCYLLILIFFIYSKKLHPLKITAFFIFAALFVLICDLYFISQKELWIGGNQILWGQVPTFIILSLHTYLKEHQKRSSIESTFKRFLDPKIVKKIATQNQLSLNESVENKNITILFCDIRNFTSMSEGKRPEEITKLLNDYFTLQVQTIFKFNGTLDKFIGDAVMAFWGAPFEQENPTDLCLLAALEMIENAKSLNLNIGIGINHGNATVGLIGSPQRMEYTVIGDAINLASRIEGLSKEIAPILISENALNNLKNKNLFNFVDRGIHPIKGRKEQVNLYSLEEKND